MNGRLRESPPRFKLFRWTKTLTELAAALRERLAIIADEESRRDPDSAHGTAPGSFGKDRTDSSNACRQRSIRSCGIFSSAAATAKRSSCWQVGAIARIARR